MDRDEQVIHQIYNAFNARDMEGVFALLTDDVAWANGMEGPPFTGRTRSGIIGIINGRSSILTSSR